MAHRVRAREARVDDPASSTKEGTIASTIYEYIGRMVVRIAWLRFARPDQDRRRRARGARAGDRLRGREARAARGLAAQTQAAEPESAQICAAISACSAGEASCGRPSPPYSSQVEGRIWYAPPAPERGLTASKLPPDSQITIASGIAQSPSHSDDLARGLAGGDPLQPLNLVGPAADLRLQALDRGLALGAQAGELRRLASASARTAAIWSRAASIWSLAASARCLGLPTASTAGPRPALRSARTRPTSAASASWIRRRYSARVWKSSKPSESSRIEVASGIPSR